MTSSPRVGSGFQLLLAGLLNGQRLFGLAHQLLADVRAVLCQGLGDLGLADAVQVADRPVELLQRVLGSSAVAIRLLLLGAAVRVACPRHSEPPCRLPLAGLRLRLRLCLLRRLGGLLGGVEPPSSLSPHHRWTAMRTERMHQVGSTTCRTPVAAVRADLDGRWAAVLLLLLLIALVFAVIVALVFQVFVVGGLRAVVAALVVVALVVVPFVVVGLLFVLRLSFVLRFLVFRLLVFRLFVLVLLFLLVLVLELLRQLVLDPAVLGEAVANTVCDTAEV